MQGEKTTASRDRAGTFYGVSSCGGDVKEGYETPFGDGFVGAFVKAIHLNAHYVNEHDILRLRQEFIDLDGGLQLEGDVSIIERYTKQLFKLF